VKVQINHYQIQNPLITRRVTRKHETIFTLKLTLGSANVQLEDRSNNAFHKLLSDFPYAPRIVAAIKAGEA
jgi:hypothetical protein